ncbi:MAG: DUF4860 domain-containing protein [Clostridia bacterium]|nr:DUF4860 domain-containing protein [Clostridia bacterium]
MMRSKKGAGSGRSISGVFVFLLIGMYALFSLLLVLIGAGVYQRITDTAETNAHVRTSLTYITSKVRAGDEAGAVAVEQIGGVAVLTFEQPYDGEMYVTRIYYLADEDGQGGALYELSVLDDGEPLDIEDLWAGDPITEIIAFDVRLADGGLELSVTMPDGAEQSMYLRLRSQAVI